MFLLSSRGSRQRRTFLSPFTKSLTLHTIELTQSVGLETGEIMPYVSILFQLSFEEGHNVNGHCTWCMNNRFRVFDELYRVLSSWKFSYFVEAVTKVRHNLFPCEMSGWLYCLYVVAIQGDNAKVEWLSATQDRWIAFNLDDWSLPLLIFLCNLF